MRSPSGKSATCHGTGSSGGGASPVSLKQRIERQADVQRLWVQPVIVWWGEFPAGVARVNDVDIVHGDRLVEWLGQLPARGLKDQAAVVDALKPGRRKK